MAKAKSLQAYTVASVYKWLMANGHTVASVYKWLSYSVLSSKMVFFYLVSEFTLKLLENPAETSLIEY